MRAQQNHDGQRRQTGGTGRAFRRAGAAVAVTCVVTGSLAGLGATAASAAPAVATRSSTATATAATSSVTMSVTTPVSPSATATHAVSVPVKTYPPKATYSQADIRAFLRSAYASDALNLAVVWGTPDLVTAKGKAGAKLRAGKALPFTPAKATAQPWTAGQQLDAFFLGGGDYTDALGIATAWGAPDVATAKSKIGAALLAHQPAPKAPRVYTAAQDVTAFHLAGYDDADARALASIWHSGSVRATEVRAGADLLAGQDLPIEP